MRRKVAYPIYLIVFLVLLAAPTVVRQLRYYGVTNPDRAELPVYEPQDVPQRVPTPPAWAFVDEPSSGQGFILLDEAHENDFELSEISYLDSRLAARGYELIHFQDGDLANALRPVQALVVIAPLKPFTNEEVQAVVEYIQRGGRLLLVGDPTRFVIEFEEDQFNEVSYRLEDDQIPLNTLANPFDLVFSGDYLYNTVRSEGNFRNIILDEAGFANSDLTDKLSTLAFYGSHSIQTGKDSRPLITADDDTWSSATDRPGGLALAALGKNDQVLAVGDVDFLSDPYYTVYDNSRFIAQIADFLTNARRLVVLNDFPFFFGPTVDLVYTGQPELGPDAFDEIIALQDAFENVDKKLNLVDEKTAGNDVIYLGLYNQAEEVAGFLDAANITLTIDPPIVDEKSGDKTGADDESGERGDEESGDTLMAEESGEELVRRIESDLGSIQMSGTALLLLREENGNRELVVLSASSEGLENVVSRLVELVPIDAEQSISDCLLHENLALCPTGVADEAVEYELDTGGAPDLEPTEEEQAGDEEEAESEEVSGIDADDQGGISLGETIEGTLDEDQAHSWSFDQGPAVINIILQSGETLDGVLELYNPEGEIMAAVDSSFEGEEERLALIGIPDDQTYTIVVRDFFDDGGDYSLTVEAIVPESFNLVEQGELPFDDEVSETLDEDEVHSWTFTIDEPATVNITLESADEMDGVLILFDPDGRAIYIANEGFVGETEKLEEVELGEDGVYTIIVAEFENLGGEYTLLLEMAG